MSADEMFEELGYIEKEEHTNGVTYYKQDDEIGFIDYDYCGKVVDINIFAGHITMQELKAINTKVKELGWEE